MRRYTVLFTLLLIGVAALTASAQTAAPSPTPTPNPQPPQRASVVAGSAFLRASPSEDAEAVTSVFEGEILLLVGRDPDGTWLWVARPSQPDAPAWILRNLLGGSFDLTRVPLGEGPFDLPGPEQPTDTGFAVVFIAEAALRDAPRRDAPSSWVVPIGAVVPVIERTPDGFWLKVNHLGYVGWVAEFLTQNSFDRRAVPVSVEYETDPLYAALPLIPLEIQLAQLERFTTWLDDKTEVAEGLVYYWTQISDGYTMECLPIAPITDLFTVTAQDAVELPELRQERAPVQQAVDDLNRSIAAMPRCGIYTRTEIRSALGAASNGRFLLRVVRQRMDNLYERITGEELE